MDKGEKSIPNPRKLFSFFNYANYFDLDRVVKKKKAESEAQQYETTINCSSETRGTESHNIFVFLLSSLSPFICAAITTSEVLHFELSCILSEFYL